MRVSRALTCLLFLASASVFSQSSWVQLARSANGEYASYLDAGLDSIQAAGRNTWEVWVKMEYASPKRDGLISAAYKSEQRRYLVRCDQRTMATISRTKFNESGTPVSQETWSESEWRFNPIGAKGGTNSTEFEAICTLATMPTRTLDFSQRGSWVQVGQSTSDFIDTSSVKRAGVFYTARLRFVRPQDVRIEDKFYRSLVSYEIGDCAKGTNGSFAFAFVSSSGEVVNSGIVPFEKLEMKRTPPESTADAVHKAICAPEAPKPQQPPPEEKKPSARSGSGTGFFVNSEGFVLTNNHVAGSCASTYIRTNDKEVNVARLIGTDSRNDLAVLKIEKRSPDYVSFRPNVAVVGEQVFSFGYPLSGVLSANGNAATGIVSALAGLGDDTSKLQISAPIQPGNSGGPLFDKSGQVIGVIVEKLDTLAVAKVIGDIPQNINFAIKSGTATAFLDSLGIQYLSIKNNSSLDPVVLFGKARNQAVYIECQN